MSQQIERQAIEELAYQKWCERGYSHGSDEQDWLDAESELKKSDSSLSSTTKIAAHKSPAKK